MQRECGAEFCNFFRPGALIAFSFLLATGCAGPPPSEAPPKPHAGVALRVAAPDAPVLRQLLQRHGNAWHDHSGATVEAVPADDPAADLVVFPSAGLAKP